MRQMSCFRTKGWIVGMTLFAVFTLFCGHLQGRVLSRLLPPYPLKSENPNYSKSPVEPNFSSLSDSL